MSYNLSELQSQEEACNRQLGLMANTWVFTANCLETRTVLADLQLVFIYFSLPENINPYFPITFLSF